MRNAARLLSKRRLDHESRLSMSGYDGVQPAQGSSVWEGVNHRSIWRASERDARKLAYRYSICTLDLCTLCAEMFGAGHFATNEAHAE